MAERTEELRRDIEETRAHMSGTLDQIGDRVSPGRIASRRWQGVRDYGSRLTTTVMGAPRRAADKTGGAIGDAQSSASAAASSAAHAVADAPERVKETASGNPLAAGAVAFGLGMLLGSMAAPSREEERLAEQLMEPVKSELADSGRELASAVKEHVKEDMAPVVDHASAAVDEVKQHAAESAETVRSEAQTAKADGGAPGGDRGAGRPF